jgi:hypothetical protein
MISIVDFLGVAHQWAYSSGRHAVVINITKQLNEVRGLRPKWAVDLDDTQRDYDTEREQGWAAP